MRSGRFFAGWTGVALLVGGILFVGGLFVNHLIVSFESTPPAWVGVTVVIGGAVVLVAATVELLRLVGERTDDTDL